MDIQALVAAQRTCFNTGKLKNLTQAQYLAKFSRAVRWRLPPQEAEEAISDYRELIFQEERDESKLGYRDRGSPIAITHTGYHHWS